MPDLGSCLLPHNTRQKLNLINCVYFYVFVVGTVVRPVPYQLRKSTPRDGISVWGSRFTHVLQRFISTNFLFIMAFLDNHAAKFLAA